MHISTETPGEAVFQAWNAVREGRIVAPRRDRTREVLDFSATMYEPGNIIYDLGEARNLKPAIGLYEGLQLVGQQPVPDLSEKWPGLARFRNTGIFDGSYAARTYSQLGRIVETLEADSDSRRAVMSIYDGSTDLLRETLDIPCTLTIQFLRRAKKLHMRVSMRSNDVWLGLPYDLTQFIMLGQAVADSLLIPFGSYTHTVGSLHVYSSNLEDMKAALEEGRMGHIDAGWGAHNIEDISRRARTILAGGTVEHQSRLEHFAIRQFKNKENVQ